MGILGLFREWQKFGLTRIRPRNRKSVIRTEVLEFRRMLSPMLTGTTLQVDGTAGADSISVTQDASGVSVTINAVTTNYDPSVTIDTINVDSLASDDQITINSINSGTLLTVDGGTGTNTLNSPAHANTWAITGLDSGTLNGSSFSNIQNLTAGGFNDDFFFYTGGYISGSIDGGAGLNALDYSNLNTGATVNLSNSTATNIGVGFANISITDFHGSAGSTDTLIAMDASNVWHIDGANSGDINGLFFFTGVENLVGGSSDDQFVFDDGGSIAANIDGGLGTNVIDYSNRTDAIVVNRLTTTSTGIGGTFDQIKRFIGGSTSNNTFIGDNYDNLWNLTDPTGNAATVTSAFATVEFQGFQNLYGGTGNDIFKFADGAFVSGLISGGAGTNTLDYSDRTDTVTVNFQTTATGIGNTFSGIQQVIGNGAAASSITGPNATNVWTITSGNAGTVGAVAFSNFKNIGGGTVNDTYNFGATGFISGNLSDTTGTNTLNYSQRTTGIVANLQDRTATAIGGNFSGINAVVGSNQADQLTGVDLDSVWTITGANGGSISNSTGITTFNAIENLVGGALADTFKFSNGSSVSGIIKGGGGFNTLDYSARSASIFVDRNTSTASAIGGGFVAIQNVVGSSNTGDQMIGSNTNNSWTISGPNAGNLNSAFFYSGIENLFGGTLADQFLIVPGGFESGTINGQGGSNTLNYSLRGTGVVVNLQTSQATAVGGGFTSILNFVGSTTTDDLLIGTNTANTWNITGANTGNLNGLYNFSGMDSLNGGTLADNFVFSSAGSLQGSINGAAGTNTLDYSNWTTGVVTNLQTNTSSSIGKTFSGISVLIGAQSTKNDNVLTANDYINTWNITSPNAGTITNVYTTTTFSRYENLNGGAQNDTFKFKDGAYIKGSLTGRNGTNVLDYSARTDLITMNLQANSATSIGGTVSSIQGLIGTPVFNATLIAANTSNAWTITGKNTGTLNSNFSFTSVANLTGGTGLDVFSVTSTGSVTGTVTGGSAMSGDWIDYSTRSTAVSANLTTGVADGFDTLVNIQNIHGGTGANTLTGGAAGSVLVGGSASDTLLAGSGRSLLIGGLGSDLVKGGVAQDIVISSNTDYDANYAALNSILAEWQTATPIATRVNNIHNGGGLNGTNRLVADVTVHNDGVPDVVYGGTGPNWLWGQPAEFADRTASDYVDVAINNAPVLSVSNIASFTIGGAPVAMNPSIVVSDSDSLRLASATVKLTTNYISSQDSVTFSSSTASGNIVGSFNAATGVLTLTSAGATATVAQFQAALRNVAYSNPSASPSTLTRGVEFQVFDGIAYSNTLLSTITFNHAPTLSGSSNLAYTTGQGAAVVNSVITVGDADVSPRLASATVKLTTNFVKAQDRLSFVSSAATGDIVASYDAATGILTLTSAGSLPATVAQYQAALRQVYYTNTSGAPFQPTRAVVFQVSDGTAFSNPLTSTIQIS